MLQNISLRNLYRNLRHAAIYTMRFLKKTNVQTNQENKWEATMSSFNWKIIFDQIMNITIDTKLRSFQYK